MAINVNNIELGEGVLSLKSATESVFTDVGATQGASLSYAPNFKEIEVGQSFAPVKSVMIAESGSFKVKLAESSMRNFTIALGLDPSTVGSSAAADYITFGGQTDAQYFEGLYVVNQVDDYTKQFEIDLYRMRAVSGLALPFTKNDERTFEVEFKLHGDANRAYALGQIRKDR